MKNKRKIIKKYLSQFDAFDSGSLINYYDDNENKIIAIWIKKDDVYLTLGKLYSLKEFHSYVSRLMKIKPFW
jgi:hypothetical protein